MLRLAFGVAVALYAANAWGAEQLQYAPPSPWVKPVPIPTAAAADSGSANRLLLEDIEDNLGSDGDESYQEFANLIQTSQGLSNVGNIVLSWRPDTESLTIHKLNIIRNGQVIDLLPGGKTFLVLRRENNLEMAMLDGALTAAIQPEGLQVGDIVNLAFTLRRHDPIMQGKVERIIGNPIAVPVGHLRIRELWPRSKSPRWRETEGLAPAAVVRSPAGSELTIDMIDAQPPRIPRGAPGRFANVGQLEIAEFQDWSDVSRLMAPLYEKAARIGTDSPLKAEAARIAAASPDPKIRAAAALRLVQDQVRYLFLGMDNGGYVPADADRTWARRFGDCKGKTALLLALLNELGIDARPALVSATGGDGLDARLPLVGVFDHVMVRARIAGRIYWMDGTRTGDRGLDDLEVPPFFWALPVQASGGALEKLETQPLNRPLTTNLLRLDASAGPKNPVPAHAEETLRGDAATMLKLALGSMSRADAESNIRHIWASRYDWIDIKKIDFSFDEATGQERLSMDGTAKMDWKVYRGDSRREFAIDDAQLGWKGDFTRDPGPHQDAPFKVVYPFFAESTETIVLPQGGAGFSVDGAEISRTVGGTVFKRSARIENGVFTAAASARSVASEFPATEASSVKASLEDLWDQRLYLRAPTTWGQDAMADGSPSTFNELIASATAAMQTQHYESAIADLTRAIALQPDSVAFRYRAQAFAHTQKFDRAIEDITRAMNGDPNDADDLESRCRFRAASGQKAAEALDDCAAAARLEPDSDEIVETRAFAYQRLGRFDQAIKDYDGVLARRPNSAVAHFGRGVTEIRAGLIDKGVADLAAARKVNPRIDADLGYYLQAPAGYRPGDPRMTGLIEAMPMLTLLTLAKIDADPGRLKAPNSEVIQNPRPVSRPPLNYPSRAEEARIEGYVDFDFTIEPDGSVGDPKVIAEVPESYGFADSALRTFVRWKFEPKTVNGSRVPAPGHMRISFRLANGGR